MGLHAGLSLAWVILWTVAMTFWINHNYSPLVPSVDLVHFRQTLWISGHGYPLWNTVLDQYVYSDHFSPLQMPLAPVYVVLPGTLGYVLLNNLFGGLMLMAFGATAMTMVSPRLTLALVVALSLNPVLNNYLNYPCLLVTEGIALMMLSICCFVRRKPAAGLAFALAAGLCYEFHFILATFLAIFVYRQGQRRWGALLGALSISCFAFISLVLIPASMGEGQLTRFDKASGGLRAFFQKAPPSVSEEKVDLTVKLQEELRTDSVILLVSLGGIFTRSPYALLFWPMLAAVRTIPGIHSSSLYLHYQGLLLCGLSLSAVWQIKRQKPKNQGRAVAFLLLSSLACYAVCPLHVWTANDADSADLQEALRQVPSDGSLSCPLQIASQAADRKTLYIQPSPFDDPVWSPLGSDAYGTVDWIILLEKGQGEPYEQIFLPDVTADPRFSVAWKRGNVIVLHKDGVHRQTPVRTPQSLVASGIAYIRLNSPRAGVVFLQRGLSQMSEPQGIWIVLGLELEKMHLTELARNAYRQALKASLTPEVRLELERKLK